MALPPWYLICQKLTGKNKILYTEDYYLIYFRETEELLQYKKREEYEQWKQALEKRRRGEFNIIDSELRSMLEAPI